LPEGSWCIKMAVQISIIGHLTIDEIIVEKGVKKIAMGGVPTYSGFAAKRQQAAVLIVSKVGEDFPDSFLLTLARNGIDISFVTLSSRPTTRFRHIYEGGTRTSFLISKCQDILYSDIPEKCRDSDIIHFGPVAGEISSDIVNKLKNPSSLLSIDIQGLIRSVDEDLRVKLVPRDDIADFIKPVDVVHANLEEACIATGMSNAVDATKTLLKMGARVSLVTMGEKGALIASKKGIFHVPAFKTRALDPTGAGDVFTISFMIEYLNTGDEIQAAAYASAAASFSVEEYGPSGFAGRDKISERVAQIINKVQEVDL